MWNSKETDIISQKQKIKKINLNEFNCKNG